MLLVQVRAQLSGRFAYSAPQILVVCLTALTTTLIPQSADFFVYSAYSRGLPAHRMIAKCCCMCAVPHKLPERSTTALCGARSLWQLSLQRLFVNRNTRIAYLASNLHRPFNRARAQTQLCWSALYCSNKTGLKADWTAFSHDTQAHDPSTSFENPPMMKMRLILFLIGV